MHQAIRGLVSLLEKKGVLSAEDISDLEAACAEECALERAMGLASAASVLRGLGRIPSPTLLAAEALVEAEDSK